MNKILLIVALMIVSGRCLSQSQGPLNPASASYSAAGCLACPGSDWNNLQNLSLPDHQCAEANLAPFPQCFQATCYYSRILFAFDFGFMVPNGATILGIKASVLRFSSSATGVGDSLIQLYTGNPIGINHASTTSWTPNPNTVVYGDSTDTWGYALTPDSVNSSLFGLAVLPVNMGMSGLLTTASVDHIEMTVYYTTGTGIQSQTRKHGNLRVNYNPTNSQLKVFSNNQKISSLQVVDETGNLVFKSDLMNGNSELTSLFIPALGSGVYTVVAGINGYFITGRFMVD